MSETSRLVQDHISVGESISGNSNVPVKLHTLLVRRPGRVSAAMEFTEKCLTVLGFGACGDGDAVTKDMDGDNTCKSGLPSKEFLTARSAALRTVTAYFEGLIDDELMVQAEFKIDGKMYDARFVGKIDQATGVVREPRYNQSTGGTPPAPVGIEPGREALTLLDGSMIVLPPGVKARSVACVEETARAGKTLVRVTLENGNSLVFDAQDGTIVG